MKKNFIQLSVITAIAGVSFIAGRYFAGHEIATQNQAEIIKQIENKFAVDFDTVPLTVFSLENSPFYAVATKTGLVYTQKDVNYVFSGKILDMNTGAELSKLAADAASSAVLEAKQKKAALASIHNNKQDAHARQPQQQQQVAQLAQISPREVARIQKEAITKSRELMLNQDHAKSQVPAPSKRTTAPIQPQAESAVEGLLKGLVALTVQDRREEGPKIAAMLVPDMKDEDLIVYPASKNVEYKGTLTVASDYTCPRCASLHRQIETFTKEGYTVRYFPYLRSTINEPTNRRLTMAETINRSLVAPLNRAGQNMLNSFCDTNNANAFHELITRKSYTVKRPPSKQCEAEYRQHKVMGDLLFTGRTPIIIWGDAATPVNERGYIIGFDDRETSADKLLRRLEKPDFAS